jgi:hypothetical protein
MSGAGLFEELAEQLGPERAVSSRVPRVQQPRRDEPSWQVVDRDALIALDHPASPVWSFVTSLELAELRHGFYCSRSVTMVKYQMVNAFDSWLREAKASSMTSGNAGSPWRLS